MNLFWATFSQQHKAHIFHTETNKDNQIDLEQKDPCCKYQFCIKLS